MVSLCAHHGCVRGCQSAMIASLSVLGAPDKPRRRRCGPSPLPRPVVWVSWTGLEQVQDRSKTAFVQYAPVLAATLP